MTDERWEQITKLIETNFKPEEHQTEELNPGSCEYYIFQGPMGRMKIERIIKPKIIDKIEHQATQKGAAPINEYIYSKDEHTSFVHAYKWDEGEGWLALEEDNLFN